MKPYFAKYLPVEGEIKEGDPFLFNGKLMFNTKAKFIRREDQGKENPEVQYDLISKYHKGQKATLFLCSRDIQVGDRILTKDGTYCKNCNGYTYLRGDSIHSDSDIDCMECYGKYDPNPPKVIGEISPEAIWVIRGMEFDEDEVRQKSELYSWNKEYNTQASFKRYFEKYLIKKATHFEYIGETDYLDESGTINLNFKVFLRQYEIKGPCSHFH